MSISDVKVNEFFPPSDRELALRGVIDHGWSTVAAKQGAVKEGKMTQKEVGIIQDVLLRAQVMERAEEIRVGLFMLKHQQLVKSCRGDGVVSCRICGIFFASQKTSDNRRPSGVQLCHICQMGVCHRCKTLCKSGTSDVIQILCQVCANQKELWRRSGAWLSNIEPKMSLAEDELLRIQEQQDIAYSRCQTTLSKSGSLPREFINPARLDSSDDTDEDEIEATPITDPKLDFTAKPHNRTPLKFNKELSTSTPIPGSQTLPWSFKASPSPEHKAEQNIKRSHSAGYNFPREMPSNKRLTESASSLDSKGSKGGHRRTAISSRDKGKMDESRQRAKFKRDTRSSSSTSGNEGAMGDCSSSCKEETASPSPVHIPRAKPRLSSEKSLGGVSSHDSSETEYENSPSRDVVGAASDKELELRSSAEPTPHTSPLRKLRGNIDTDSSSVYATVEFNKTAHTDELFAKVKTRRSPTSDAPKDFSEVTYSQVDFTKTAPKPPSRAPPKLSESDSTVEFAKVKSRATVVAETATQRKGLETITEESPPLPRRRRDPVGEEPSPKVPSRSASLKRKSTPSMEDPPPPPVSRPSSSERQKKALPDLPPVDQDKVLSPTAPVPRSRSRKPAEDTMIQVTPPTPRIDAQFKPPIPDKEQPRQLPPLPAKENSKPVNPPLPAKDKPVNPPLPAKDKPVNPPLPAKDKPVNPPLPAKDKPVNPPLPAKENSKPVNPPLPAKDKPALPQKERPEVPKKDPPQLPQKDVTRERVQSLKDKPKKPPPQLPQKDKSELPQRDRPQLPQKDSNVLAPSNPAGTPSEGPIARGTKMRSTISDRAIMGSILTEFKKKQERLSPADTASADVSDGEGQPSPRSSPIRRRNARRSGRSSKSHSGDESFANLSTSGEDLADGGNEDRGFRGRARSKAISEPMEPDGDTRTRSSAVSETRSRVRSDAMAQRPTRPVRRLEARSPDVLSPSGEGARVTPRPRSHSPAADGM